MTTFKIGDELRKRRHQSGDLDRFSEPFRVIGITQQPEGAKHPQKLLLEDRERRLVTCSGWWFTPEELPLEQS